MLKKLTIALISLVFLSSFAYAEKLSVKGSFDFQGRYLKKEAKPDVGSKVETTQSYYDQDLKVYADFNVSDKTAVKTKWAIYDRALDGDVPGGAKGPDVATESDDDVTVERAYLESKQDFGTLSTGVMSGGTWGTLFGDTEEARNRIKFVKSIEGFGTILGIIEKNTEGDTEATTGEIDSYYLGLVKKVGDINIKPLLVHTVVSNASSTGLNSKETFYLTIDGKAGLIGFESELQYIAKKYEASDSDSAVYGAYLNGWIENGPMKTGLALAYGSHDYDAGKQNASFDFGEDFDDDTVIIDDIGFNGSDVKILASTMIKLYSDYQVNDKLALGAKAIYLMSNTDYDGSDYRNDTKGYEVDLTGSYKLADDLTYSFGAAYASFTDWSAADTDYNVTKLYHKISVTF